MTRFFFRQRFFCVPDLIVLSLTYVFFCPSHHIVVVCGACGASGVVFSMVVRKWLLGVLGGESVVVLKW